MTHLRSFVLLALAAVLSLMAVTAAPSSATFTDRSTSTATVAAALDWVSPTVSLGPLASPARGVVTVNVEASDAESSVAQVVVEVRAAGAASWSPLCTDTTRPYGCSWDTSLSADGAYEVRARAVDAYDNVSSWVSAPVTVSNGSPVALRVPGEVLRATVRITAERTDTGARVVSQGVEMRMTGSGTWASLCQGTTDPVVCKWQTHKSPDGSYELRAWSRTGGGQVDYSDVTRVQVANSKGTASRTSPEPAPVETSDTDTGQDSATETETP